MSNPIPVRKPNRGVRIAAASVATALALGAVVVGGTTASAATAPIAPKAPTAQQVDARASRSMVQLGIQWSGRIAWLDQNGQYNWTEQPVEASYICSGWFVDSTGDIVTAGHCITPKGSKEKLIDAYVGELRDSGAVDDAWIAENLAWAERTWKVENSTGGTAPDRKVVAYQSERTKGAVLTEVTPASVVGYRSPEDEDVALLNVDAVNTPAMPLAATSPKVGQAVTSIGFPGSVQQVVRYETLEASFKTGSISSRQVNDHGVAKLEVNADISGGMSGGPTIDRLGNVVGLNSFTITGEQENFNFVTDTVSLRKFLQREGITVAKPIVPVQKRSSALHGLVPIVAGVLALIVLGLGGLWIGLSARRGRGRASTAPVLAPQASTAAPAPPVRPVPAAGAAVEPEPVPASRHAASAPLVLHFSEEWQCPNGHGTAADAVFCATCGTPVQHRPAEERALV